MTPNSSDADYVISFPTGDAHYWLNTTIDKLAQKVDPTQALLLVDEEVLRNHSHRFESYRIISIPSGEQSKTIDTLMRIVEQLNAYQLDRQAVLVGVGGGVVTDLTGFLSSIYLRGIRFGFVPTTLLAMVDAAIGGKNGVNVGLLKNQLGLIRQPSFLLYDYALLSSLDQPHWASGMAEVIKYACIFDEELFTLLQEHQLETIRTDTRILQAVVQRCVAHKNNIVLADEQESGQRKWLNFGHTAAHALEILYNLSHGQAVAYGMLVACILSEQHAHLDVCVRPLVAQLIQQYGLSTTINFDVDQVLDLMRADKKRKKDTIDYVLISAIGVVQLKALSFDQIKEALLRFADEYSS